MVGEFEVRAFPSLVNTPSFTALTLNVSMLFEGLFIACVVCGFVAAGSTIIALQRDIETLQSQLTAQAQNIAGLAVQLAAAQAQNNVARAAADAAHQLLVQQATAAARGRERAIWAVLRATRRALGYQS